MGIVQVLVSITEYWLPVIQYLHI